MAKKQLAHRKQNGQLAFVQQSASFTGPLPHPDILVKYNDALPNGAERLTAMAEAQARHRMELEKAVVRGNVRNQAMGSVFAFVLGLIGMLGGIWLIGNGKSAEGLTSVITSLAVLSGLFVFGRGRQEKERKDKFEPKPDPDSN